MNKTLGSYKAITSIPGYTEKFTSNSVDNSAQAYAYVPLIYRAVQLRCDSLASVPIAITNKTGRLEKDWPFEEPIETLIWNTEAALLLKGAAYWEKVMNNTNITKDVKWRNPYSIDVEYKRENDHNLLLFTQESSRAKWTNDLTANTYQMVYFHEFDPSNDLLPGVSAAQVALTDAQLLRYLSRFASIFFENGAMPVVLLPFENIVAGESERVENFFKRQASGIRNAWRVLALRGQVDPKILTQELKSMVIPELHDQARRSVAAAFKIPQTMLEDAANFATAQEHTMQFWQSSIRPRAIIYENVINKQLLEPFGLKMKFSFDEMDIFQTDEAQRAGSLLNLVNAGVPLKLSLDLLGYDLSEEQWEIIEPAPEPEAIEQPALPPATMTSELRAWQRKAINRLKDGKSAAVEFISDYIPESMTIDIKNKLEGCKTAEDIRAIFKQEEQEKIDNPDPMLLIADELKRANDLLERTSQN